jgi:myo-inositol-1(or 4)-monophosphatase
MDSPLQFTTELTIRTGRLLVDYFSSTEKNARQKADQTVVTDADLAADRMITKAISERYPNESILSEEINTKLETTNKNIWVIDPLDGTTNFSLGLHYWGVSITRLVDGHPQITVLHFPLLNETYSAKSGKGAFLNNELIHVKPPDPSQPAAFFATCSRAYKEYKISIPYKSRIIGSAVYNLCSVARGIAVAGFEATPKIWDIAGGWLLVNEAGGKIGTIDGTSLFPLTNEFDYSQKNYPTISAATEDLLIKIRKQINQK